MADKEDKTFFQYRASPLPKYPEVQREFQRVAEGFRVVNQFDVVETLVDKPRQGLVVFMSSAGATANSQTGEGLYVYLSTGWAKLN